MSWRHAYMNFTMNLSGAEKAQTEKALGKAKKAQIEKALGEAKKAQTEKAKNKLLNDGFSII